MEAALAALAEESFVALTTLRRTGEGVATPVWVARVGDALVVTTNDGTGKVKRIRRDPTVTLQPCSRRGQVRPTSSPTSARAEVVADATRNAPALVALRAKYGLQLRVLLWVERRLVRGRAPRVILWIT